MLAYLCESHSHLGTGRLPSPCWGGLHWDLRHAGALDRALARKARILPGLGKEFPAGDMRVAATAQDDDTRMGDMGKVLGMDIPSGETGRAWA
jgi:hypothetical protein